MKELKMSMTRPYEYGYTIPMDAWLAHHVLDMADNAVYQEMLDAENKRCCDKATGDAEGDPQEGRQDF
jgi:hypothetical protein